MSKPTRVASSIPLCKQPHSVYQPHPAVQGHMYVTGRTTTLALTFSYYVHKYKALSVKECVKKPHSDNAAVVVVTVVVIVVVKRNPLCS